MKRALVLVEGPTEEQFVKATLRPHLWNLGLDIAPTVLVTKVVKSGDSFTGGVTTYGKFKNDIVRLLQGSGGALVTMMLDYYGLPNDFPGMRDRPAAEPVERVRHVEKAIRSDLGGPDNFYPFLMLHEFEALLFSSPEEIAKAVLQPAALGELQAVRDRYGNPEDINEQLQSAPSKRILRICPGYRKALHGPTAASRIGLLAMKANCPHFAEMVTFLESWAAAALPA